MYISYPIFDKLREFLKLHEYITLDIKLHYLTSIFKLNNIQLLAILSC